MSTRRLRPPACVDRSALAPVRAQLVDIQVARSAIEAVVPADAGEVVSQTLITEVLDEAETALAEFIAAARGKNA